MGQQDPRDGDDHRFGVWYFVRCSGCALTLSLHSMICVCVCVCVCVYEKWWDVTTQDILSTWE
jgi:hypothetical protein